MNLETNYLKQYFMIFHKNNFGSNTELKEKDVDFVSKNKIFEMCLEMIQTFIKLNFNKNNLFNDELKKWNTQNNLKLNQKDFIKYNLIISYQNKTIINPYIELGRVSKLDNCIKFLKEFNKLKYYYPFFESDYINDLINKHNKKFDVNITKEQLIGNNKNLSGAFFGNHKGLKYTLLEALKYYDSISRGPE